MSNYQHIIDIVKAKESGFSDMIDEALKYPYMLPIAEFIVKTKFNIDTFVVDRFWHNLKSNVPIYLDHVMLNWCGFQGELKTQKLGLTKVLRNNEIKFIELKNSEYEDLLRSMIAPQSNTEETKEGYIDLNKVNWPATIRTGKGYGRATHILIAPRDFKKMVMRLNTSRGDQIREYFVSLEDLFHVYFEYQVQYRAGVGEKFRLENNELHKTVQEMKHMLEEQSKEIKELLGETHAQTEQLNRMESSLEVSVEQRVPPTASQSTHENFMLYRLPQGDTNHGGYQFYVIRSQKVGSASAIRRLKQRYPEAEQVVCIVCQPNARNLFNRIKERVRGRAVFAYNNVRLTNMHADEFLSEVPSIESEKLDIAV
jgi:hypothetical protein